MLHISHETIYRRIRSDKKAGGSLWRHTRIMSKFARKRYRGHDSRGGLPGKRPIADRPPEAEARRRIGHWEGDTVHRQRSASLCSHPGGAKDRFRDHQEAQCAYQRRGHTRSHKSHPRPLPPLQDNHLRQRHRIPRLRTPRGALPRQDLLRHSLPLMGARQQRESQRTAAPVPTQRLVPACHHAGTVRLHC